MKLLFSFKGHVGRGKFIGLTILYMLIYILVIAFTSEFVVGLMFFVYMYVNLTLSVKRLRDMKFSPWLILLYLVPAVNLILFLLMLFIKGKNVPQTEAKVVDVKRELKDHDADKPVVQLKDVHHKVLKILEEHQ